jgi:hypothetical protein
MHWPTGETLNFVEDMEDRGLIVRRTKSINRAENRGEHSQWWWEIGKG